MLLSPAQRNPGRTRSIRCRVSETNYRLVQLSICEKSVRNENQPVSIGASLPAWIMDRVPPKHRTRAMKLSEKAFGNLVFALILCSLLLLMWIFPFPN